MKKNLISTVLALSCALALSACGNSAPAAETQATTEDTAAAESSQEETKEAATEEAALSDEEAAANVAALIDAIYVQTRTDETDAQCEAAKAAWDKLTDEQKAMVEGEEASPEYFGLDTGDASKDDPLNADGIGENEILVVSFGTSYNDSRAQDIGGIEKTIAAAYPDWAIRRAFTAQIIINHVQARDGVKIDNMDQALERAVANGVKNLIIQPTHLMHGAEYDELVEALDKYRDRFESVAVSEPMLGTVGADAKETNADKEIVAKEVVQAAAKDAGYKDAADAEANGTAIVLLGHGTAHIAKVTYSQMQTMMGDLGYKNVFVGTVEGEPEETEVNEVVEAVKEAGYKNIILRPFMVVAGDHANNDMAGDEEDSWKSIFAASGAFDKVDCQIAGLGRVERIEKLYVDHIAEAMKDMSVADAKTEAVASELEDGEYLAEFKTDSSMLHLCETEKGQGLLTVKDGKMTFHAVLSGTGFVNMYVGLSEEAKANSDKLLNASKVTVKYDDGTTEEVNAFDIPVPAVGKDFDLAVVGKKEKWYDHKVSIQNPVKK